jgi:hypothetical protein
MRYIKTFLLHLNIDVEMPDRTCGDVRPLDETRLYPFKDFRNFEMILLQLANKRPQGKMDSATPPNSNLHD